MCQWLLECPTSSVVPYSHEQVRASIATLRNFADCGSSLTFSRKTILVAYFRNWIWWVTNMQTLECNLPKIHLKRSAMGETMLLLLVRPTFLGYVEPLRHPRQTEDHPIDRSDHLDTMLGPAINGPFDHRKESLRYRRRSLSRHRGDSPSPGRRSVEGTSETTSSIQTVFKAVARMDRWNFWAS